jgi:hypothetical protein
MAVATPVAARHEFGAGLLGHDLSASQWIVNVSERTLLGVDVAFACVRLMGDIIAGSEVGEWDGEQRLPPSPLTRRPDPDIPRWEFLWELTATLMLYQRAWIQSADLDGTTLAIRCIAPSRVVVIEGELYVDSQKVAKSSMRLFRRAVYPTLSGSETEVMQLAREVFAAEMAAGAYRSDFWQQGGAPVTILKTDQAITSTQATDIQDAWVTARTTSPGKPAVLGMGADAKAFGTDLGTEGANQAGDKLKASIARYLGVFPSFVNVASEAGPLTYSTVEQESIRLVRFSVQPYCDIVGNNLSEYLPGDPITDRRVVINPDKFMRPDLLTWYTALSTASGGPFITREEARAQDGRAEVPLIGDFADTSLIESLGQLVRMGFDPQAALSLLGLPSIEHTGAAPVTVQQLEEPANAGL